jgi:hypothetical protein
MTGCGVPAMSNEDSTDRYLELVKLALDEPARGFPWREDELRGVWQSQLAAPLSTCVQELGAIEAMRCETLCAEQSPAVSAVRDLLHHEHPNAELLRLLASWTQRLLHDPGELLPREVALGLFNAAVVVARVGCGVRLVALDDEAFAQRAEWVASRPWLDDATRTMIGRAIAALGSQKGASE